VKKKILCDSNKEKERNTGINQSSNPGKKDLDKIRDLILAKKSSNSNSNDKTNKSKVI